MDDDNNQAAMPVMGEDQAGAQPSQPVDQSAAGMPAAPADPMAGQAPADAGQAPADPGMSTPTSGATDASTPATSQSSEPVVDLSNINLPGEAAPETTNPAPSTPADNTGGTDGTDSQSGM
jgi:hypothetical protein